MMEGGGRSSGGRTGCVAMWCCGGMMRADDGSGLVAFMSGSGGCLQVKWKHGILIGLVLIG